jgi:hypothetical protein
MIESPNTEMHLADFARFTWVIAHHIRSVYSGFEDKRCWRRDVKDRKGGVLEIALACLGLILHVEIADLASSAQGVSPALGSIVACLGYQLVLRCTQLSESHYLHRFRLRWASMDADPVDISGSAPHRPQNNLAKPTVACMRCREQKLRCDRELPQCQRCLKQRTSCTYPSPPDRKRIAQRTNRAKASMPSVSVRQARRSGSVSLSSASPQPAKRPCLVEEMPAQVQPLHDCHQPGAADLPSTEVGLLLLEVYFKRIYNASMLFHKGIAFQLYMQDGIPGYLLRAIFAQAAVFLKEVEDSPHQKHIKTLPLQSLHVKSWSWARSASVEALAHADEPSLIRVQALQVLQLYYFSQGEINRAIIHASLAYRLSQLLGYDKLYEEITPRGMQFDREMRRRSFWASWCTFIIGSNYLDPSHIFERVSNLPLPARFGKGGSVQGVELTPGKRMDRNWNSSMENSANHGTPASLLAELVKLLGIW